MGKQSNRRPKTKSQRSNNGNKRNNNASASSKEATEYEDKKATTTNDPAWYAKNPQLLKDAASYPFSQPLGSRYATNSRTVTTYQTQPGIVTLRTIPTFGFGGRINLSTSAITADINNPMNVAAAEIFTYVRHMNSGARNYEAADLMMYIGAMSQVYSAVNWAIRIYGLARMYEQRNRYMPRALMAANGVDFDSVANNLADYRYRLNVIINKVASLKVPSTLPLFKRQAFMYMNVYAEGPSIKDQLYMYAPDYFLKFGLDSSGAGQLATQEVIPDPNGTLLTFDQVLGIVDRLFQAIWDEEDFATMSGDIMKAYQGSVMVLNTVNEDYGLIPVFDPLVLTQMKNTRVTNNLVNTAVHQVPLPNLTNLLVPMAYWATKHSNFYEQAFAFPNVDFIHVDRPITIDAVEPGPELVIESTRMNVAEDDLESQTVGTDNYFVQYLVCGTEICRRAWYGFVDGGTNLVDWNEIIGAYHHVTANSGSISYTNVQHDDQIFVKASLLQHFKYAPACSIYTILNGSNGDSWNNWSISEDLFEVDNYSTLGSEELRKLHESAIMSLLDVSSQTSNIISK